MLSRDHNILWLPESNGYPTSSFTLVLLGSEWVNRLLAKRNLLSLPSSDSRSVLAVKGSLRRAVGAPLTAPGRSETPN